MKKDTIITLVGKGILVGMAAGVVVILYRLALESTGTMRTYILNFIDKRPLLVLGCFLFSFFLHGR